MLVVGVDARFGVGDERSPGGLGHATQQEDEPGRAALGDAG